MSSKRVLLILLAIYGLFGMMGAEESRHRRTTSPVEIGGSSLQPEKNSNREDIKYSYQPQIPPQYSPQSPPGLPLFPKPTPPQRPPYFPPQTVSPYPPQYPPQQGPQYIPQKPPLSTTPYPPQYLPQTSTSKNPYLPQIQQQHPTQRPPNYPSLIPPANTIDQFDHRYEDGGYEFRYALPDETVRYERGYIIYFQHKKILVVKGYYSYRLPDYRYLTVFYTADQYGYRQDSSTFSNDRPLLPRSIDKIDEENNLGSPASQNTTPN